MNILITHPGKELESLWATARAAAEFGVLHVVVPEQVQVSEPPRNLAGTQIHLVPAASLVEGVTITLNTSGLPKFDLAIIGCSVDDDPATRSDRQKAASEAYRRGLSALSVVMIRQPGERLAVKSIQYVVERLLRAVVLAEPKQRLVLDACIPNLIPNQLKHFSLTPEESDFVSVSSLIEDRVAARSLAELLKNIGSRNAYTEASKVGDNAVYHFKGALLADKGTKREEPPAGGGEEIAPYEVAMLRYARGRVLDVGCGDGRIAVHLMRQKQRRTLPVSDVVGIDLTPLALETYKKRFEKEALHPCVTYFGDFMADDWQHLGKFDTMMLCGHNFGIAADYDQVVQLLAKLKLLANPGSRLLGSSRHPLHPRTSAMEREVSHRNLESGFGAGERWLRLTYQTHDTGWFQWYYLSPQELEQAGRASGWRLDFILYEQEDGNIIETLEFEHFEAEAQSDEYGVVLSIQE